MSDIIAYYAGIVQQVLQLDIQENLEECMDQDQDLRLVWDEAIFSLRLGLDQEGGTEEGAAKWE